MPKGFTKIRPFGLLAPCNVNTKLERAEAVLTAADPCAAVALEVGQAHVTQLLDGIRAEQETAPTCPSCDSLAANDLCQIKQLPGFFVPVVQMFSCYREFFFASVTPSYVRKVQAVEQVLLLNTFLFPTQ